MKKALVLLLATAALTAAGVFMAFFSKDATNLKEKINREVLPKSMDIKSSAFDNNAQIPASYTCDGQNISPPLSFADVPPEAKSLALIVDDPDAPMGTWVHWLVWNINPDLKEVDEDSKPAGGVEGVTSFGSAGWGGPCPPSGTHRYFFKLYALDVKLELDPSSRREALERAMKGHILDQAELIGLYSRK